MKKLFSLVLLLTALMGVSAQSIYNQQYKPEDENKDNKKNFSHWSVTLEGGANMLDADVLQTYNDILPTSVAKLSLGASVEYTFTPVWSMGLEYYYLPFKAKPENNNYLVNGTMHTADLFTAFNFQKLFFRSSKSKWGIWATLGGGVAYYNTDYWTNGSSTVNNQDYPDVSDTIRGGIALTVPVGAIIEYNFSKNFALGTKIQYRAHNKDNIDGRNYRGVTNDFIQLATLQLRWKFNAINNNHTRNINVAEFEQTDELMEKVNGIQGQLANLKKDVDNLKPQVQQNTEDIAALKPKVKDLDRRVNKLEDIICPDGPDTDGDGVPDCRDKEPNTPAGKAVDFYGREQVSYDQNASIYFDFNKTNLDSEALTAIRYAANKLKSDPSLVLEVRGFTDNVGGKAYNDGLSQRRADKVKDYLVKNYNIEPNRIIANGDGKYDTAGVSSAYRPYRTCTLLYSNDR